MLLSTSVAGLDITFTPGSVFANTTSSLTLLISVPLAGTAVTLTGQDSIAVSFPVTGGANPPALLTTLQGVTATPPGSLWNVTGPKLGKFVVFPTKTQTLQPGDTVKIQFGNLAIVNPDTVPVAVPVPLTVNIGGKQQATTANVTVQANTPGIIAWADPPVVGLNNFSTLRWSVIGGTIVRVTGYNSASVPSGYKDFPVGGVPNTPVNASADSLGASQNTYTLTLLAEPGNTQVGTAQNVVVNVHVPVIVQFGFQQGNQVLSAAAIDYGQTVTAQWNCKFVDPNKGVTLAYNTSSTPNLPITHRTFDPSAGLPANASTVPVSLTAPGLSSPATQTITVNFNPVQILYFKYSTWTQANGIDSLSGITFATSPLQPQGATLTTVAGSGTLNCLNVTGPGGPLMQYLGQDNDPHLEIRYFSTAGPSGQNTPVQAGVPFTLYWFTNAAAGLTLNTPAGDQSIAAGQIAKGSSQPLTIKAPTTFTLTATAPGQASIVSRLTVTPA